MVDATPGVTRDRNQARARWQGREFLLVDTGGVEEEGGDADTLLAAVRSQTVRATEEADAIIVLLDGRAGFTPRERALVDLLRRAAKPVFFAVNKLDTPTLDDDAVDFFRLGVDRVYAISAAHGRGVDDLMEDVLAALPAAAETEPGAAAGETTAESTKPAAKSTAEVALAIVGRPNVGKSSLLNRLVGAERAIVSPIPGTTRDPLDSEVILGGRRYVLIDTAGIRRRPKVFEGIERASVARALRALDRAELALLVLDAGSDLAEQDARIATYAWDRGRGLLLVVNKWDAVPAAERDQKKFRETLAWRYPTLAEVAIVFVSALTGAGVGRIVPALERLTAAHRAELQTATLNKVLVDAVRGQAPPSVQGKRPAFYYATQTGTAPPTIAIFSSAPRLVGEGYERYLRNQFCAAFGLHGTPLRIQLRLRPRDQNRARPARPGTAKTRRPRGPRGR